MSFRLHQCKRASYATCFSATERDDAFFRGSNPRRVSFLRARSSLTDILSSAGCDVSRLRDFIQGFYAHGGATQNVDDAYCAFVWSVVVQQPEVRVGIAPAGVPEVYIAPQQSKVGPANKSHNKKKGDASAADDPSTAVSLDIVADATLRSLEELKAEYGDALRIAVDPQRSFVAITGSHIRVYAFISRCSSGYS